MQNRQQTEKEPRRGAGKGGGWKEVEEGMEKQGLLACIVLLLIPPLRHTKTFDTFQWLSPTLPVPPTHSGLHKLTQHGSTHSQAHRFKVCPHSVHSAVRRHEICPSLEAGVLVCSTPASPSSLLSSILHGSTLLWGPYKAFMQIDGLWLAWK